MNFIKKLGINWFIFLFLIFSLCVLFLILAAMVYVAMQEPV